MTRLGIFIRLLFQSFRNWIYVGIHCPPTMMASENIHTVHRLAFNIDNQLLKTYTPYKGKRISIVTGFRNVPETLQWLEDFTERLRNNRPITEPLTLVCTHQPTITMEDYLVNSNGGTITPDRAHYAILESLTALIEVYNTAPEDRNRLHYDRRIRLLFPNIVNILEGLSQIALKA